MTFLETTVYTAQCDLCATTFEDDEGFTGWTSIPLVLEHAIGWAVDDEGHLICPTCRRRHTHDIT